VFARFVLAALVAAGCGLQASAADLGDINRVILKEPRYQTTPKYCLLVFGKDASTRIWLVQDGVILYVDRNGSGDLTEPGKRLVSPNGSYVTVDQLVEKDGTVHKHLHVQNFSNGTFSLKIGPDEEKGQYVGFGKMERPSWSDKAENAPIIHFNGPLSLERYAPIYTIPRGAGMSDSRRFKLRLLLGTPGLGKGTFASFDDICSENLGPIQADIEYPSPEPFGTPVKQRLELIHDG
jgi:hypothetical protein